jgi:hypothetical protein
MAIEFVSITPGTGKDIAVDTISAVEYQVIKIALGADGAFDTLVDSGQQTMANSLPVVLSSDHSDVKVTLDSEAVVLGAGSAAVGKLAANSGVDIGDVDVTSIIPGTGATNLGKAIDTALGGTDTGVLALTVRDDTLATLTEADGDVSALRVDSTGRLWCNVSNTVTVGSHAVTNAGTFAVQVDGAALTALQLIDDSIFTDDAAFTVGTSKVTAIGVQAVAHGSNPDAADALDAVILLANRHRILFAIGGHPNAITYGMSITTAVTNAIIGPTIGTGLKLVVTGVTVVLDNGSTVFPSVAIGFGASTTPAFATTPGTIGVLAGHPAVPAGGGFNRGDGSGIIGIGADGEELRITTVGTAGGNGLYVVFTGYTIES